MVKVLVAVKRVLDYNVKVRVKADGSGVDLTNLKMSMNPFDEIAVEEAVRLKEAGHVDSIVVVSLGSPPVIEQLRAALALGVDEAILVQTSDDIEPLDVAKILTALARQEGVDLIILGKQAIDNDCNQTGQMTAALLGWAQGTFVSKVELQPPTLTVTREVDGGLETLQMALPAVITTDLRLNEPRYPKLPNIMKAKQKPLKTLSPDDLGVKVTSRHQTLKVSEPKVRTGGIKVASVQELVQRLQESITL